MASTYHGAAVGTPSAHDIQLAGWLRGVRKTLGALPAEWEDLLDTISRARGRR